MLPGASEVVLLAAVREGGSNLLLLWLIGTLGNTLGNVIGGAAPGRAPNIVMNVGGAADADAFRKSQGQITASLARAVQSGSRRVG